MYTALPVFKVWRCDCSGELIHTGENQYSCKDGDCGYPHKCDNCGKVEMSLVKYPFQTYVRGLKYNWTD